MDLFLLPTHYKRLETATTSQTLPNYQPAGESLSTNPIPEAVPISSSGSIGPFFAVISVLTILAFLSCVLGRILTRDQVVLTPLEGVRDQRSCFAWLKRKCRFRCLSGDHCPHPDVEVGSTKVKGFGQRGNDVAKVKQGDKAPPQEG